MLQVMPILFRNTEYNTEIIQRFQILFHMYLHDLIATSICIFLTITNR